MFEYRKALKASIERNEFGQLLRGEGAYFYEDKLSSGPVDYASALRSIYELYKSDNSIKSLLHDELMKMISEENEKVIMALTYLMFHLSYVDDGDNSFDIDVQNILNRAKEVVDIEAFSDEEKNVVYKIDKMMQSYKYSFL